MKKFFILSLFSLSACSSWNAFYPYDGHKTITGNGGFIEAFVPIEEFSSKIKNEKTKYDYDFVSFYREGLPFEKKCKLLGYFASNEKKI